MSINAYISNISFPKSLDELYNDYIIEHGQYHVEDVLYDDQPGEWTAPTWAKIGDIVFFMHAKYAFSTITALRKTLKENARHYTPMAYNQIMNWLNRGMALHKQYGGKIFAIARVVGAPLVFSKDEDNPEHKHWKSRIYADIGDKWLLNSPIDISEFRDFIHVSRQGSITLVYNAEYILLKEIILAKNYDVPGYFLDSVAASIPLSKIDSSNWLGIAKEYRRSFILEQQFRAFYVDYFLKSLGDKKTIYKECRCRKAGNADSFIDNIILINKKYLPVEIKLNINTVSGIHKQVEKYCNDEHIYYDSGATKEIPRENIYNNNVLIIDTEFVYLYDDRAKTISRIIDLDDISSESSIRTLREHLVELLA